MDILEEKQNPLFDRKEVKVEIEADIPPSKVDARKMLAEKFSTDEANIKLEKVDSRFGSSKFILVGKIYGSAEEFARIEPKPKQKKEKK